METEIFATFGPACRRKQILKEMIEAGMTGMRWNLSHTMLSDSKEDIKAYQDVAKETAMQAQILIDMQGPELRIGEQFFCVKDVPFGDLKEDTVFLQEGAWVGFFDSNFCQDEWKKTPFTDDILQASSEKNTQKPVFFTNDTQVQVCPVCTTNASKFLITETPEEGFLLDDGKPDTYFTWIPVVQNVIATAEAGDEILLDDGKLLLQVEHTNGQTFYAKVLRGGKLQSRKSIKIVGKNVKMPPLTEHDIENIKQAKDYGVTALMQPFVLCGEDLKYVRAVLKEHGAEHIRIYAKIENAEGVKHMEDILPEADVLIIARGDLGNDMPLWELPRVQKQIENACKKAKKPYIVVTQMLASMEKSPVPTRAEVSDIFHAIFHGAWGVMLTGETAIGSYPIEAVRYLANTAKEAEKFLHG